jgi:hypothetical protein
LELSKIINLKQKAKVTRKKIKRIKNAIIGKVAPTKKNLGTNKNLKT